jgi:hypothetical protein
VVLDEARNPRVVDADERAQAAGVRPGMTLGAALAAAPQIDARPRDAARELALMQRLAGIAAAFSHRRCPSKLPTVCCSKSSRASACSEA